MPIKRERLATARKAAGYSQESLADRLGVERSTVGRWESGETTPQPWLRPKIAKLLGLSHERLGSLLESDLTQATIPTADHTRPESAVMASQEQWRSVRRYLGDHGPHLARDVMRLYGSHTRVPDTPTMAPPGWIPQTPIPLDQVTLAFQEHPPRPVVTGTEPELRPVLPLRTPRHAFPNYTSTIRYLDPPRLFENRPSYRLLDVDGTTLTFGLATYFDKLNITEALAHEYAAAAMGGPVSWPQLPFRSLITDPFDLASRIVNTGICTLTIRRDTADGSATFFLLGRDPTKVAVGGGEYGVIPAGEFQPASIGPESLTSDLDIWRNMIREYSEELLGQPEHDGSSGTPLDYETWPFYRDMRAGRAEGRIRAYYLGAVCHGLGLSVDIMTAVIIDDILFDDLFRDLVDANAEGRVLAAPRRNRSITGLPFTAETVSRFLHHEPVGGMSAACLALSWQQREKLGLMARG